MTKANNLLFYKTKELGVFLYLLQFMLSFSTAFLLRPRTKPCLASTKEVQTPSPFSFSGSIQSATMQAIYLCAYVLFFSVIGSIFLPCFSNKFGGALLLSLLEIGSATSFITTNFSLPLSLSLCAFSACFSGVSVYFQAKDCINGTDVSTDTYLPVKLLCGTFAFLLSLVFLKFY